MSNVNVIQPEQLQRDDLGHWTHSAWPQDGEENAIPVTWFADQGLELAITYFENDAPDEMTEAYYENGQPELCREWQPSKPDGEGWFVFSIHETDDGPICVWVRHTEAA